MLNESYARGLLETCGAVPGLDGLRGKRVLVTGATGLIGSCLADALRLMNGARDMSIEIYAAGRSESGMRRRFGPAMDDPRFHFVPYDATKPPRFDFEADCIVHAATSAHPLAYAADPVGTMQANLLGVMNLLEYLRERPGGRLVLRDYTSFAAVIWLMNHTEMPLANLVGHGDVGARSLKEVRRLAEDAGFRVETLEKQRKFRLHMTARV